MLGGAPVASRIIPDLESPMLEIRARYFRRQTDSTVLESSAMRDWFPNFRWSDLITLGIVAIGLCSIWYWGSPDVVRMAALPVALVIAYVVFVRWRRRR